MPPIKKCPECEKEGRKSSLYGGDVGSATAMYYPPFTDEKGVEHVHDGNRFSTRMHCSNGHRLKVKAYGSCHCGWSGGKTVVELQRTEAGGR